MKTIFLFASTIVIGLISRSQDIVQWNFSVKNIADKTYEIHLTPTLQNLWHIYSQTSPEGGAIPTKISFNKNPLLSIEGKTKEIGKIISKYEEVFEITVKYFEGSVDFVQLVKLKNKIKTNISGTVEFMACNNEQCTSPKTVPFIVKLE